ncbi:replication stress response regulator SDE2 [Canna indica]|uniref:Replication stress response regulator SDE2 n=1 Tax=Canna indica TaxID=4628 RepID=A0AAQ3L5U6_9LILI|nr:replication stress response regulator SDE2 [Canna indica]
MTSYQIFVKLLDGHTRCLQIPSPTISGETLSHDIAAKTGIPVGLVRLFQGPEKSLMTPSFRPQGMASSPLSASSSAFQVVRVVSAPSMVLPPRQGSRRPTTSTNDDRILKYQIKV